MATTQRRQVEVWDPVAGTGVIADVGAAADEAAADAKRETGEAKDDVGDALQDAGRDLKND